MDKSRLVKIIILFLLITFAITGCDNSSTEMDKEAAIILQTITDQYNEALEELEDNQPYNSKEILKEIDQSYLNYPIKDDINSLLVKVDERIQDQDEVDFEISKIDTLIKEQKFNEAKLLISLVDRSVLNIEQKDKMIELYEKLNTAIAIIGASSIAEETTSQETKKAEVVKPTIKEEPRTEPPETEALTEKATEKPSFNWGNATSILESYYGHDEDTEIYVSDESDSITGKVAYGFTLNSITMMNDGGTGTIFIGYVTEDGNILDKDFSPVDKSLGGIY